MFWTRDRRYSLDGSDSGRAALYHKKGVRQYHYVQKSLALIPRAYPGAVQAVLLLVFLFIFWQTLLGAPHGENNAATSLIWTVWWPLLPLSFFFVARSWCAVCPLGTLSALAQRLFGGLGRTPGRYLRAVGPWFMAASVLAIAVANLIWGLEEFPLRTGIFFGILLAASFLAALVYSGRAWCRYLCPIGALSGVLSMFSILELRPDTGACSRCSSRTCRSASKADSSCPPFETPLALDSNKNCNLCGDCVQTCSGGAFTIKLRNPFRELQRLSTVTTAEFVMIMLFLSMTWFEAFRMTQPYRSLMKSLVMNGAAPSFDAALLTVFVLVVAAVGASYFALARTVGRRQVFAALIPLALAGHLAVGTYHLLIKGPRALAVGLNAIDLPFLKIALDPVVRNSEYTVNLPIKVLQIVILMVGVWASIYVGLKLVRKNERPGAGRMFALMPSLILIVPFLAVLSMPVAMMH
jgi:polyferredoxin